jgi:peptide/nickel transport system substrate-binding protein
MKTVRGLGPVCGPCGRWALAALALAASAAAGCAGGRPAPLRVTLDRVPATLDPHHHNEIVGWSLLCNFYDALVRFSPEMKIEPALAQSWTVLDGNRVRFVLRRGVRFANGQPLTSADVVASFDRALRDPRSGIRHQLVDIRRVVADGEDAVVFETVAPAPTLVNRLAFLFIVPRAVAGEPEIAHPLGTGPYRFLERRRDGSVVAEGWAGWHGMPEIGRAVFSFVENEEERGSQFLAGGVDVSARVVEDVIGDVDRRQGLRVEPQPSLAVQLLVVAPDAASGETRRALADPRVRRAMLLGIDRAGLVGRVFRGNGAVASQFVHPVVFGYDPDISAVPYDPARARQLLAEAGFANGFSVDLAHGSIPPEYAAGLVEDLGRLGVHVRTIRYPLRELLRRARAGQLPLMTYGRACTTGDASEFLDSSVHTRDAGQGLGLENFSGTSDPETDALLEAADRELDSDRRLALLQRAQRRVLDALPILPLTVRSEFVGVSDRVSVPVRYDGWLWVAGFRWRR